MVRIIWRLKNGSIVAAIDVYASESEGNAFIRHFGPYIRITLAYVLLYLSESPTVWGAVCLKTTKLDCLVNIDDVY